MDKKLNGNEIIIVMHMLTGSSTLIASEIEPKISWLFLIADQSLKWCS